MNTEAPHKIYEGRNVKCFPEMLDMKQEMFADELGNDWIQKNIFQLESKEEIEPDILEHVAKILKVPAEAIKNLEEEKTIYNNQNIYEGSNYGATNVSVQNYHCTFHSVDKVVELFERLFASEKDKKRLI